MQDQLTLWNTALTKPKAEASTWTDAFLYDPNRTFLDTTRGLKVTQSNAFTVPTPSYLQDNNGTLRLWDANGSIPVEQSPLVGVKGDEFAVRTKIDLPESRFSTFSDSGVPLSGFQDVGYPLMVGQQQYPYTGPDKQFGGAGGMSQGQSYQVPQPPQESNRYSKYGAGNPSPKVYDEKKVGVSDGSNDQKMSDFPKGGMEGGKSYSGLKGISVGTDYADIEFSTGETTRIVLPKREDARLIEIKREIDLLKSTRSVMDEKDLERVAKTVDDTLNSFMAKLPRSVKSEPGVKKEPVSPTASTQREQEIIDQLQQLRTEMFTGMGDMLDKIDRNDQTLEENRALLADQLKQVADLTEQMEMVQVANLSSDKERKKELLEDLKQKSKSSRVRDLIDEELKNMEIPQPSLSPSNTINQAVQANQDELEYYKNYEEWVESILAAKDDEERNEKIEKMLTGGESFVLRPNESLYWDNYVSTRNTLSAIRKTQADFGSVIKNLSVNDSKEMKELRDSIVTLESQKSVLESQVASNEDEMKKKEKEVQGLQGEIELRKMRTEALESKMTTQAENIDKLKSKIVSLESEKMVLESLKLASESEAIREKDKVKKEIAALTTLLKDTEYELESKTKAFIVEKDKRQELETKLREAELLSDTLSNNLDVERKAASDFIQAKKDFQDQLNQKTIDYDEKNAEYSKLLAEGIVQKKKYEDEIDLLKKDLVALFESNQKKILDASKAASEAQLKFEKLTESFEDLKKKYRLSLKQLKIYEFGLISFKNNEANLMEAIQILTEKNQQTIQDYENMKLQGRLLNMAGDIDISNFQTSRINDVTLIANLIKNGTEIAQMMNRALLEADEVDEVQAKKEIYEAGIKGATSILQEIRDNSAGLNFTPVIPTKQVPIPPAPAFLQSPTSSVPVSESKDEFSMDSKYDPTGIVFQPRIDINGVTTSLNVLQSNTPENLSEVLFRTGMFYLSVRDYPGLPDLLSRNTLLSTIESTRPGDTLTKYIPDSRNELIADFKKVLGENVAEYVLPADLTRRNLNRLVAFPRNNFEPLYFSNIFDKMNSILKPKLAAAGVPQNALGEPLFDKYTFQEAESLVESILSENQFEYYNFVHGKLLKEHGIYLPLPLIAQLFISQRAILAQEKEFNDNQFDY